MKTFVGLKRYERRWEMKFRSQLMQIKCWTLDDALQFARQIADENILWFEEPIPARDFFGYQQLVRESPIPIAARESLCEQDE
jgi:hypothetical protein